MRPRLLVIGRSCVAMDLQLSYLPSSGHVVKGKGYTRYPSGSGINTAVALSRLGIDSVIATRVGNDNNGLKILQYLTAHNVDVRHAGKDISAHTGMNVVMTEADKKTRKVVFDGATTNFSVGDVESAFNSYPDAVIVNTDVSPEAVAAALIIAKKQGIPIMLCMLGEFSDTLSMDIPRQVDLLVIDEGNVEKYTGISCATVEKCLRASIALATKISAKHYIIKLADRGSFLYDGKYYNVVPAYDVDIVTTNAVAECFNAALFYKYMRDGDAKQGCELATIAEVIKTLRPHSADNCPTFNDLREFIAENELDGDLLN